MSNLKKSFSLILTVMLFSILFSGSIFAADDKITDSKKIKWYAYDEGLKLAKESNKQIVIDFTAKWCGWCKKMEKEAFIDPQIVKLMNEEFIAVRVDGDSRKELDIDGYKITEKDLTRQEFKITGYPAFWFLESDGTKIWFLQPNGTKIGPVKGYRPAENFLTVLNFVKDRKYDTTQVKQKPSNKEN